MCIRDSQKGVEIGNGIIEETIGKIIPDIRGREAPVYHSIIVVEKLGPKFPVVFQKLRIYCLLYTSRCV